MQRYTVYFVWKLLYMFRVVPSPIIRSANNYLQHLVFVTPLLLSAAMVEELELVWVCCGWRTRFTHSGMFLCWRTETAGGLRAEISPAGWNDAMTSSEILFYGVSSTVACSFCGTIFFTWRLFLECKLHCVSVSVCVASVIRHLKPVQRYHALVLHSWTNV